MNRGQCCVGKCLCITPTATVDEEGETGNERKIEPRGCY